MKLSDKSDDELESWINNHEKRGVTDTDLYRSLLEERARRNSTGLNAETSLRHLLGVAKQHKFTTYGDVAKANGVSWNVARHAMNGEGGHLDNLLDICHARGMPLLTALCVNQNSVDTGDLSDDSMKGFIKGAKRLGYLVTDEQEFLRECQRASFSWAEQRKDVET
jgi:hypothetical protein